MRIKRHLEKIVQYASTEVDDEKRRALLTISVAGSGFTGIEMAGELIDWRKKFQQIGKYLKKKSQSTLLK